MIEFRIYDATTGDMVGTVAQENLNAKATFKIMGGCETAVARFHLPFGDAPPVHPGDALVVARYGVPIFSGRCRTVEPHYGSSEVEVFLEGWWYRVAERRAVESFSLDHITFGQSEGSDHPGITTAFEVFQWIVANRIATDPASLITVPPVGTLIKPPAVPCKLAGPFLLYAQDDLTKVLSMLATMDDAVTGVDAEGRIYYLPRTEVRSSVMMTVNAKGNPPADWRNSNHGVPTGGSGRFVYDHRGPNSISIFSRTTGGAKAAVRNYTLETDLPPGTVRNGGYRAANIHTGVQARRLARGLFLRYSNFFMKVEQLEVRAGTMQFEPHRGKVRVVDEFNNPYAEDLCGTVEITFHRSTIAAVITIGENAADPGSDIPFNDPWARDPGWLDDPIVDIGDGLENPDYPIPSFDIDFDDGWDGDGDDFHENDDREFPEDPPGVGVDGMDYGEDEVLSQDPDAEPGEKEILPAKIYLAGIVEINPPTDPMQRETYNVQLYKPNGTEATEQKSNLEAYPEAPFRLSVGQKVLVVEPEGQAMYVDGAAGTPVFPGRISALPEESGPTVEALAPLGYSTPTPTVLATFTNTPTFPPPAEDADPGYEVGQLVTLLWFNNMLNPHILQTGGGNTAPSEGCFESIMKWGTNFG